VTLREISKGGLIVTRKEIKILDLIESVTDSTISMIQSTVDDSIKKQLIARYCGRLSTWEASWKGALKEGHGAPDVSDKYSERNFPNDKSGGLIKTSVAFSPASTSSKISDSNRKSVSAINKVLERYNLMRKRSLH
jgi:hypothetical protein